MPRSKSESEQSKWEILGVSSYLKRIREDADEAARLAGPVLIQGPTGTGKENIARRIHEKSERRDKPFVPVNCGGIPKDLVEREIFGHVKGAFTGANRDMPGKVDEANGGVLFLGEIGELSKPDQVKLLRFLSDHSYNAVGDSKEKHSDVRIIAATNQDLLANISDGSFRQDFYRRIAGYQIETEPLVKHREDLVYLTNHFFQNPNFEVMSGAPPVYEIS